MYFLLKIKLLLHYKSIFLFISSSPVPHLHPDSYSMESLYSRIILDISLVTNSIFIELCIMHYPALR